MILNIHAATLENLLVEILHSGSSVFLVFKRDIAKTGMDYRLVQLIAFTVKLQRVEYMPSAKTSVVIDN